MAIRCSTPLADDDWSSLSEKSSPDSSQMLPGFNIDFDFVVNNVVFCALIGRVGKYQLSIQK